MFQSATLYATLAVGLSILGFILASPWKYPIEWKVSDFAIICGLEDCNYNFNIVSNATGSLRFKIFCSSVPAEDDYSLCQDKNTEAKLLHIEHTWIEGEARYTAHGDVNITETAKSFTVPVTRVDKVV
ncbi:hypothetical protein BDV36DRAFT_289323 [Aspergillus pseudocaelatus]|uniref:Transmembrane protein n=1 Tax=Aspergillus pseudocaelatus TaxID=1825620 RepID=A0ABQ6W5S5_9EURO|nr:hypothetical protein BDV36DRAFT_289323 [Aspergillus pseudocaelatus]